MGKKLNKKKFKKKKFHSHNNNNHNNNNNNNHHNQNNIHKKENKKLIPTIKISNSLEDAKFRIINEKLYKSSSDEALSYFQSNSEDFITYHKGFSLQAKKWPSNPNDLILKTLLLPKYKSMSIADIGCGEAKLAKELIPLGYNIKSFDLVAINDYVTIADMKNLPLENSTIDLAIYCLSLMNKNFIPFIVEANRILKKEGKLLVAEISSRIVDLSKFLNVFEKYGFKLIKQRNLHDYFEMLTFKKIKDCLISVKDKELEDTYDILKPCLYKKR